MSSIDADVNENLDLKFNSFEDEEINADGFIEKDVRHMICSSSMIIFQ